MPAKASKVYKKTVKKDTVIQNKSFLKLHWLQDTSVEAPLPPLAQSEVGQRELSFTASVKQVALPHDTDVKLEMWLRIHVQLPQYTILMSEICYAGVVEKTTAAANEAAVIEELYQYARPQVEGLLAVFGHNPPLPPSLNQ
jgi:hypothetical protein